jgi:hypothetical protein
MINDDTNRSPTKLRAGTKVPSQGRDTGSYYYSSSIESADADGVRAVEVETAALRAARARRAGRFLKGPIPMADIAAAARLPGKGLAVLLAVHHRAALTRNETVKLPAGLMNDLGVTKDGKARALRQLEAAGMITVHRKPGRSPIISMKKEIT